MIRAEEILENQMIDLIDEVYADSGLGRWFGKGGVGSSSGGGWDRYNSSGKKAGKCGDAKKGSSYSACLGKKYADRLRSKGGKKAIANWVKRKKSAQNKAGRGEKGRTCGYSILLLPCEDQCQCCSCFCVIQERGERQQQGSEGR
jgi:hypothetical protein